MPGLSTAGCGQHSLVANRFGRVHSSLRRLQIRCALLDSLLGEALELVKIRSAKGGNGVARALSVVCA